MIKHVWSLLCSNAITDSDSNNISIHNILEQLTIHSHPKPKGNLSIRFEIVSLWIREDADNPCTGTSRVTFLSPSGKNLGTIELKIDLSIAERSRNRIKVDGIQLEEQGRYIYLVELKNSDGEWESVAEIPLTVKFSPPEDEKESEIDTEELIAET
jgi:hypothetical protein